MITPSQYRTPGQLEEGGVLVVGAAATGIQLADEIQRSGRQVTVAVGGHVRSPRVYRGMDIQWWMDVDRAQRRAVHRRRRRRSAFVDCRRSSSPALVIGARSISTRSRDIGVRSSGKFAGIDEGKAQFSGSLRNQCALADLKLGRLLDTIDEWASENAVDREIEPPHRFERPESRTIRRLMLDITKGRFQTIIWATGFRPDYSWLDVPVVDERGYVRHDGGVVDESPGMYVLGMPFLRRRKSTLIDGAADDANDLSDHLAAYLAANAGSFRPRITRHPWPVIQGTRARRSDRPLAEDQLERRPRLRRHRVRRREAGTGEQLDRSVCREHAPTATNSAQVEDRRGERIGRRVHEAEGDPAARPQRLQQRGKRLLEVGFGDEERREPHGVVGVVVTDLGERLLPQSDSVGEARPFDVRTSPLERRVPDVDADDGRRGPHVRRADREQAHPRAHVEEARDVGEVGVCRLDRGRHHHRAATPPVEDDRVGERPACRTSGRFEELVGLVHVEPGEARDDRLLLRRQLVEADEPGRLEHAASASATSGGASAPACWRVRYAPSAPSASAAVLHCMTLGITSSKDMTR